MTKVEELTVDIVTVKEFNKKLQEHFLKMCSSGKLFRVALSGADVWKTYLKSFDNDPIFRDPNSSEHNCNTCNNFIRRYGNIVSIDENYNITTIFDFSVGGEYAPVVKALSKAIKSSKILDVFFETFNELNSLPYEACKKDQPLFQLGVDKNVKRYTKEEAEKYGVVKPNEIREFNHIHLFIPNIFVDNSGSSVESIMGEYRDAKNVFKRAMDEIPLDTLLLVKDLINQGSLLDGATHLFKLDAIIPLKEEYDQLKGGVGDNWCWVNSYKFKLAKFKNELIGVLCSELAEGKELNEAAKAWNKRVDPVNYMKTTAPITKRQIEEAKKFVEENGYVESFNRRFANLDDIKVSEILHSNAGKGEITSVSIFDSVKSTSTRHKRSEFDKVEEVSIEKFMKDILPGCTSVEAFLTNQHEDNMVSLTTANNPDSKPIFKWSNNYSWTYNGNLAGKSQIKETVASKGGKVDGVLRFSGIWNDSDGNDHSDLDLWCQQPGGETIGFSQGYRRDSGNRFSVCGGQLDLDDRGSSTGVHAENIYFRNLKEMRDGVYMFWIHQYSARNSKGFKAEIEFDGEVFGYEYDRPVVGRVQVAEVILKNGVFSIKHVLPESSISSKEIYGLETNRFHKVNLVCLSPNHWDGNSIGNKHYFFMLDGCKTDQSIRSFHNENLLPELAEHRKVLEVLGSTNMIEPTDKQLSGLGYNATVKDELIVKLSGSHKRIIRINI
jgi:hypothetical protein